MGKESRHGGRAREDGERSAGTNDATGGELRGHVAVVTGANHGIGAATARALARRGADVLVSYLRMADPVDPGTPSRYYGDRASGADGVIAEIRAAGGRAAAVEIDLTEPHSGPALFDEAERNFGTVDILINNASGWIADTFSPDEVDAFGRHLLRVSPESVRRQFAVDAHAGGLLISELARRLIGSGKRWGRIVSLASGGPDGFPGEVSYGAAKAALENYAMSAAYELSGYGITSNVLHPPVTDTGWVTDAVRERVAHDPKLLHVAEPAEVAEVICYLVSERARLITGNVIRLR